VRFLVRLLHDGYETVFCGYGLFWVLPKKVLLLIAKSSYGFKMATG
jgi:hypothetical protein